MPETETARHFFAPGPKRLLALDGGGTKGIIELAFLARMETLLREHTGAGDDFRLADWFDLIGGTSTGSIIAAGLAMGKSVAALTRLYLDLGPPACCRCLIPSRCKIFCIRNSAAAPWRARTCAPASPSSRIVSIPAARG
jgi:hypothetical protein